MERRAFLDGHTYQHVGIAEADEMVDVDKLDRLQSHELERLINLTAVRIIQFSESQWSNDYFDTVHYMSLLWKEVAKRVKAIHGPDCPWGPCIYCNE